MAYILDWDVVVSEFEFQSLYYIHLRFNTNRKFPNTTSHELNSIISVF